MLSQSFHNDEFHDVTSLRTTVVKGTSLDTNYQELSDPYDCPTPSPLTESQASLAQSGVTMQKSSECAKCII